MRMRNAQIAETKEWLDKLTQAEQDSVSSLSTHSPPLLYHTTPKPHAPPTLPNPLRPLQQPPDKRTYHSASEESLARVDGLDL